MSLNFDTLLLENQSLKYLVNAKKISVEVCLTLYKDIATR